MKLPEQPIKPLFFNKFISKTKTIRIKHSHLNQNPPLKNFKNPQQPNNLKKLHI